jgi:3-hydroxyisobutyrate dehydrogenase
MERIGFIGTGIMGLPMARNLLKAGYSLTVHNRTRQKAQPILDEGAKWADSPADVATASDIVITCVTDTPDVREVLLGPKGVIHGAHEGLICVDTSTISPTATKEMAEVLNEKSVMLLDAPISGGESGAIEGKLSIMMGGPKKAFDKVKPVMEVMGRTVTWCGPVGSGQITKLANQIMVIHTLMSMAEGLAFAERAGLNLDTTWNVTRAGAAGSHSLSVLGRKAINGDFKPAFMVDLQLKDLRLVTEYADQIGQPLPGTALVRELLKVLQARGRGRDGTQSLFEVIRELSG